MKHNRRILLVLWILSLIGISFYGGAVSYGIFFLLTFLPVVSLLYILAVIALFKIYQNLEGNSVVCKEPAVFHFILQNESPLLFAGVRPVFYSSFSAISGLDGETEYELRPHSGIRRKTAIVCHYRGEYEVGIKALEITDLFRLFTITYRNREPLRINVKPRIVHLNDLENREIMQSSVREVRTSPSEADVFLREYVPGDDPRLINWKASAVHEAPMVRERSSEQQEGIGILLDPRRYDERKQGYLPLENQMLELVIALNLFFSRQGIPVETCVLSRLLQVSMVNRENGFDAFYEMMSGYRFDPDRNMTQLFEEVIKGTRIFDKKTVILVIHEWNETVTSFVHRLSQNNVRVQVYLIARESFSEPVTISRTEVVQISAEADLAEVL